MAIWVLILTGMSFPSSAQTPYQRRTLELELEQVEGSSGYDVQVEKFLRDGKKGEVKTFHLKSSTWKATLNPGHYEMKVRTIDSRGVPGEWAPSRDFIVPLFPPLLKEPKDASTLNSDD